MTHPAYRNRGLIRAIMDYIRAEYAACDGLYLYASDNVLSFYPKFGFMKAPETRFSLSVRSSTPATAVPYAHGEQSRLGGVSGRKTHSSQRRRV